VSLFGDIAAAAADIPTDVFGVAATYYPGGTGSGIAIRAILDLAPLSDLGTGQASVYVGDATIRVRKSEIAAIETGLDKIRIPWDGSDVTATVIRLVDGNGAFWVLEVRR
jgi:hypothetical protein